jgi:HTH-type transcriptional regulator/antitoxin HipB
MAARAVTGPTTAAEQPPTTEITHVATTIRQRRRGLGLTQDELADLAACSPRFVRELETGKQTVRLDKLVDVLTALGLELAIQRRLKA